MSVVVTNRPRRTRRRGRFEIITIAVALIAWISGGLIMASAPASAATPTQTECGYADEGTGTFARTICWFDFSGYVPAIATSPAGQDFSVSLPGGYSLEFNIKSSTDLGVIAPYSFPTYAQAFLGNTYQGQRFYTGCRASPRCISNRTAR